MYLPYELVCNAQGTEYVIDPSFNNCLEIMLAYEDPRLLDEVKHQIMYLLLFQEPRPPLNDDTMKAAMAFLDGSISYDEMQASLLQRPTSKIKAYSFAQDLRYIIAAIQRTHRVNIREVGEELHWWSFMDMFMDISEDCTFAQMITLRIKKAKNKLTKDERKVYAEMKSLLVLKHPALVHEQLEAKSELDRELERLESLYLKRNTAN